MNLKNHHVLKTHDYLLKHLFFWHLISKLKDLFEAINKI